MNQDPHPQLVPAWVRQEMAKLLDSLDGRHDTAMVGAVAMLGPDGFDFKACEQSLNFDPGEYGPLMLEGLTMIAGAALGKTIDVVHAAHMHEDHFSRDIEDDNERFQALRNQYEQAIRQFLQSVLTYAGGEFQREKEHGMSVIAGSQLLSLWQRIATSTITFHPPKEGENDETQHGPAESG